MNRPFVMRIFLFVTLWISAPFLGSFAQTITNDGVSLTVLSGTSLYLDGMSFTNQTNGADGTIDNDGDIFVDGDWTNNATGGGQVFINTDGTGTVHFINSALQTLGGSETTTFENMTVNNTDVGLQLGNGITVVTTLTMTDGDIDLNGNNLDLSTSGTMTGESNANRVFGTAGEIIASDRDLSLTSTLYSDIAGLGISITTGSGNTPGTTTFERGHAEQTGDGNTSILRYFDISPTTNSSLDATLNIEYYDNELNGQSETDFVFWKSTDGGSSWTNEGGTVNTSSNFVEKSGVNELSRWTISNESTNPLPIELIHFDARYILDHVRLEWSTATETNNDYFTVEKAKDPSDFHALAEIDGTGNSYRLRQYTYFDRVPYMGISYYRLKQTDFDGTYSYSRTVSVNNPRKSLQLQAYPNPNNNRRVQVKVMGLSPKEKITIQLYNSIGKLLFQDHKLTNESGQHEQSITVDGKSGNYVLKVISKSQTLSKKLVFN